MKAFVRVLIVVCLAVVIVLLSFISYRAYHYLESPQSKAFSAIPSDATILIKSLQTQQMLDFCEKQKVFFSVLFSESSLSKINDLLKELSQSQHKELTKKSSFYLSLHDNEGEENVFFAIETSKEQNAKLSDFFKSIQKQYTNNTFIYKDKTIYRLQINNNVLFANSQNGLLLMSFDENLMRMAINQMKKGTSLQNSIEAFPNQRNANTELLLCLQHKHFIPYLKNKIRKAGGDAAIADMFSSCQWTVFDIEMKKDDILFSGYTSVDNSAERSILLTHFNNVIDFEKILSQDANRIFPLSVKNVGDFQKIKPIVQVTEDVFSLMFPTQIILFETKTDTALFHYLIVKSGNSSEAAFHLFNSLGSSFENGNYLLDTFHVGASMAGQIHLQNFVLTQLGIGSQLPLLNYYTIIDDYIIFTDEKEGILHYLSQIRNNQTLKKSTPYNEIQSYFSDKANLFYYYKFSENETVKNMSLNYYAKNIDRIRFQFYAQSDSTFISNIVLRMK